MNVLASVTKHKRVLILFVLFVFAWTQRINIRDFFDGVFEGYGANAASRARAGSGSLLVPNRSR